MKTQNGTLTKRSGKWLGHYSRWLVDSTTGEKKRQQKSYVVGAVESMTKAEARRALRTKIEQELGLRSDSRVQPEVVHRAAMATATREHVAR